MSRVSDGNLPVRPKPTPIEVAHRRAATFSDPLDRIRFLEAFEAGRVATAQGKDLYPVFRRCMDTEDSVTLAGLVEGAASTRSPGGMVW